MLNNVRVEEPFVKIGYSNWKSARSADKGFQKHESLKCHQTAIQRLLQIQKTTQDVSTLKKNLTETQCENRVSLLNILSCLRYLAKQGLHFREHGDDKDSKFKELLNFRGKDDLAFSESFKTRIKPTISLKLKIKC